MTSLTSTSLIRFPFNSVPSSFFITLFKSLLVANSRVLKAMSGYNHFLNLRTPWLRGCKYLRDTFWSIDTAIHKWTYWVTKTMVSIKYYTALYNGLNATRAERWMLSSVLVSSSVCSPQAGESLEKAFSRSYLQRKKKGEIKAKRVGVPQGSILGPKLFSLYVNDFPESVTSGELYMFADDTTIFTISDNIDTIIKAMQVILDQVLSWCVANRLIAHETKSEALLLSKQRFIGPLLPLKYGEKFIELKSSCKCLGVTIDSNLSWQEHTKSLLKSFNKKIAVLRRIKFLPSSILQTIYFRTVLPSVLYGILVWGSCSPALMDDLERAHIRASKLIFKLSRNSNADQLNKLKGWNNLSFYYTKRLLVEAYKSYYRRNTNVLNDLVMLKQSSHCLRKSMNIEFPSPKSEIGRLTFKHRAAIAWNSLPDSIKKSSSLECFKKRLRSSKDLINSISYNKESSMIRNRNEEFLY